MISFIPSRRKVAEIPDRCSSWLGFRIKPCPPHQGGFSFLEFLIVISLMATVYVVAMPNLSITTTASVAGKLGQLRSDIRAAFDMAVLHRRPHRLVFHLLSGRYWLETTDAPLIHMGDAELGRDLTEEEERDRLEAFDAEFEEYIELAGTEINDANNERVIPPMSPVVQAKEKLRPAVWRRVTDAEWKVHSLGPELIFQDIRTEHHDQAFTFEELEDQARAMLYFLPSGYVERAIMHIAFRKGEREFSDDEEPYTLITNPFSGLVDVEVGYKEMTWDELTKREK